MHNKKNLKPIGVATIWLACIGISLRFIFGAPVDAKNTTLVIGHYYKIEKEIHRGDISYNLYINENRNYYKIAADNSDCFYFDSFKNEIKEAQPIHIWITKSFLMKPMIVRLAVNNADYLSFDCANKKIDEERQSGPFLSVFIGALLTFIIYKRELIGMR